MIPTCDITLAGSISADRGFSRVCGEPAAFKYEYYANGGSPTHKLVCADCAYTCRYRLPGAPNVRIYEDLTPIPPYVGMPCTIRTGSDRTAATVVYVSSQGSKIVVREDRAIRTDDNGMSESQTYEYERDPAGEEHDFFRPRQAAAFWQEYVGLQVWGKRGNSLVLGERSAYHDYSF